VDSPGIVKVHDVAPDGSFGVSKLREVMLLETLEFQSRKEAFGDSVVPAISLATHTTDNAEVFKTVDVRIGTIRRASV